MTSAPETLPPHPAIAAARVADGELLIGDVPVTRLAAQIGRTPFYAYDRARLDARIAELRRHLPESIHLNYAIKANPIPAVVQHLARLVDGFDVASAREMQVALDTPMPRARVSFAGPGKTRDELARAVAAGIVIALESEGQMRLVADLAAEQGLRPAVAVRVNPDFELKSSGMRMGGGSQQFGVDAERVPQMLGELGRLDLDFIGFHIFAGSQNLDADILCDVQRKTVDLAIALARHAPAPVRHLNMGGGFGIPYFPKDRPLDLAPVGDNLATLAERIAAEMPQARTIVELGRYIVGEAGFYVARIIDRKESRGQVFLVTDGGLHHHLAASGNFGQVIRRNYPVAIANRMDTAPCETASVVGCLCTPLDLLAGKVALPRAEVGDLVVVFQSGAYGLSASPTAFLGHPEPAEVMV
ncbi:MAG: pyridoxal-dependent decarboxylase, exosortase A system-associated [Alphaproteobacteria bacterium]|nr:MAG: pyridoxal-dependent decarboxylase, exosortase A system-associated [Alphaproteobacteria bacterium]